MPRTDPMLYPFPSRARGPAPETPPTAGLKIKMVERSLAEQHYSDLSAKPFFSALVDYIISGPVVCMVWEVRLVFVVGLFLFSFISGRNLVTAAALVAWGLLPLFFRLAALDRGYGAADLRVAAIVTPSVHPSPRGIVLGRGEGGATGGLVGAAFSQED